MGSFHFSRDKLVSETPATKRMATNIVEKDIDLRKCAGVGQGISGSMADEVRKRIEDIPTTPFYLRKDALVYPFEALDSSSIMKVVKPVVDAWLRVRDYSIQFLYCTLTLPRTTKTQNGPPTASGSQAVPPQNSALGPFFEQKMPTPKEW